MAGFKVVVLERRGVVGGAAVTEEFHPGFRNSVAAYTVSLLTPKVIADLRLAEHGLRIVERQIANFLPLDDGRYLKTGGGKTHQEVAKFSARDADRLDAYQARLEAVADVLRALVLETPPNVVEGHPFAAITELIKSGRIANRLRRLGLDLQRELLDLFTNSAGDYLDGWFESDPIKAAYGLDGVVGNYASPYTPGSAYVLLHHCFGEVNGKKGVWGHAIGGMGAITQAMAKSAAPRRRGDPRRCAGARGHRREGPGGRRGDRERRGVSRPRRDLEPQSEAALSHADRPRGAAVRLRASASRNGAAAPARSA